MALSDDILWFKTNFGAEIERQVAGTPFDLDMLTALACQETGSLWRKLRRDPALTAAQVAAFCCGDTLDADKGRRAFPRTKADLVAVAKGPQMFAIARAAVEEIGRRIPEDYGFALNRPNKFCHGFGVFQLDLQFFLTDPEYFLQKRYEDFGASLGRALGELTKALSKPSLGLVRPVTQLSDIQFCHVAIVYNTGGFRPSAGLRQGHFNGAQFYGEAVRDFLATARRVRADGATAPAPSAAPLPPSAQPSAAGPFFRVDTVTSPLRLRSEPRESVPKTANVIAEMPDGTRVRAIDGTPVKGFLEIEVAMGGRLFRGFASTDFLVPEVEPAGAEAAAPVMELAEAPASFIAPALAARVPALPEAHLTPRSGTVIRRRDIAGALSLNEAGMPGRTGSDPAALREGLGEIIAFLEPDNDAHKRYKPRDEHTFCNIYAHDYCALAGVYLPRVWWTGPALLRLAAGEAVAPRIGATVDEQRANDLFRWLRDFGQGFGWRRAASLDEVQNHANLGGVALIVALRKQDGRSGHIVAVVPETADESARRGTDGKVTMPLQSQAGSVNFSYGRSTLNWWTDAKFADAAFWLHG